MSAKRNMPSRPDRVNRFTGLLIHGWYAGSANKDIGKIKDDHSDRNVAGRTTFCGRIGRSLARHRRRNLRNHCRRVVSLLLPAVHYPRVPGVSARRLIQDTFILTTSEETPALVMKDGKIYKNLLERTVSSWPSGFAIFWPIDWMSVFGNQTFSE